MDAKDLSQRFYFLVHCFDPFESSESMLVPFKKQISHFKNILFVSPDFEKMCHPKRYAVTLNRIDYCDMNLQNLIETSNDEYIKKVSRRNSDDITSRLN